MNSAVKTALFSTALALATAGYPAHASVKAKLVVQPLGPSFATSAAEDMLLYADAQGSEYLYVEQQQGAMLSVFDVTNPAHIKLAASVETGMHRSYDFVSTVGNSALIVFRDGSGDAVLDLDQAKAPRLIEAQAATATELLGTTGYLASTFKPIAPLASQASSVQVVTTAGATPRVVTTVANVTKQASRPETGTTFLLGATGVTVVRQIDVERAYKETLQNRAD
jgi:hypothetical protein